MKSHHAPIVSSTMFDEVQNEMQRRKDLRTGSKAYPSKYSGKSCLSGLLICGQCGGIRNNGEITDKEYEHQSQQVGMKIDQLLMRKEEILSEQGKVQLASYRIEEVTKLLQTGKILEEFDRVMFKSLVRKITVLSNKEIEIEFECGITVRETL